MLDPKKLLGEFLGGSSKGGRSGMGDLLGGLSGSGHRPGQHRGGSSWQQGAGRLGDLARDNPMATSALMALLGSRRGRKMGTSKLGLAAIAGLGYLAYKNYKSGQKPTEVATARQPEALAPPPANSGFAADPAETSEDFALALVRAMIAAAKADGHIDATERAAIVGKLSEDGLDAEEMAFLQKELEEPVDLDRIVAAAKTEEQKVELYTASRLAVDADNRAERGYLDQLAGRLGLPDALVEHIEATVKGSAASA